MRILKLVTGGALVAVVIGAFVARTASQSPERPSAGPEPQTPRQVPYFEYDETFPKPLPNAWATGTVVGISVDAQQHIWIVHRGSTLRPDELRAEHDPPLGGCCRTAPPVIEFDYDGNVVQAWGGPSPDGKYDWPSSGAPINDPYAGGSPSGMHSIFVDHKDNVWLTATGPGDGQMLKFTRDGKFLLQFGRTGLKGPDSNSTDRLGQASGIKVFQPTNEVFLSDGYVNHRVIVLDGDTGAYKRHWGAYGKRPDDSIKFKYDPNKPFEQFSVVHGIGVSNDGLVYACDRNGSRVHVFKTDGTFVMEKLVEPQTFNGSVFGIAFSSDPEQKWAYIPDGRNEKLWILERKTMEIVSSLGCPGHAGGCFTTPHSIDVDGKGNIYIGETWEGKRVQRFLYKGLRSES